MNGNGMNENILCNLREQQPTNWNSRNNLSSKKYQSLSQYIESGNYSCNETKWKSNDDDCKLKKNKIRKYTAHYVQMRRFNMNKYVHLYFEV